MKGEGWMEKFVQSNLLNLDAIMLLSSQLCLKREKTLVNHRLCLVITSHRCVNPKLIQDN